VPVDGITNINTQDIDNISILKDAASSSIYGVRAANGVILITTRRGKAGKMRVDLGHQSGFTKFISLPEKVNAVELAKLHNIMDLNDGVSQKFSDQDIQKFASCSDPNYPNHNMLDAILKNGVWNAHSVAISGGTDKTTYNVSLGYIREGGIIDNTDLKKYSMRTNLDFKVNDKISLGLNLAATMNDVNTPAAGVTNIISLAYYSWANDVFQAPDGRWIAPYWSGQTYNARAYNSSEMGYDKHQDFNGMATFFAEYKVLKGLKLRGSVTALQDFNKEASIIRGVDLYSFDPATGDIGTPVFTTDSYQKQSVFVDIVSRNLLNNREMTYQLTGNYNKVFGKHSITVLAGLEKRDKSAEYTALSRRNLLSPVLDAINSGDPTKAENGGATTQFGLISTFGRLNYIFDDRYLVEGNLRYDGSSRFTQNLRYDLFPSVSVGWRINREKFFNVRAISDMKLRASYGILGNQEVGDYQYLQTYILSGSYFFDNAQQAAIIEGPLANPNLKWEKTNMKNLGLDIALLNNRISLSADYFIKNTEDILLSIPQPAILGAGGPVLNAGSVRNKGFEVNAGYFGSAGKVNYYVRANFSKIKNEITDLAGTDRPGFSVGDPISNIFGYKALGLFQSDAEIASSPDQSAIATPHPGDIKYADISGPNGKSDGKITDLDRVNLGHSFPGINYGISIGADYKGFDISMVWQGIGDAQFMANGKVIQPFLYSSSPLKYQTDVWTPDNKGAEFPRITSNGSYYQASSFWLRNAAYLKLRNAQIGYSLPKGIIDKMKVSKLRVYISGENLLTIKRPNTFGYDPEQFYGQGDPVSFFGTNHIYPTTRRFLVGVNLSF
jgi:TonB-linked SusC/RagA family outer membrane protein